MSGDASPSPTALEIARRLLARDATPASERGPEMDGATLHRACARVAENLCDAMGEDGCNALLARALARTEAGHPALKDVRRLNEGRIHLDGVAAGVEAHGVAETTAAIEALLAALVDVLGRLIGEDMAIRILDHDPPRSRTRGGAKAP